MQIVITKVLLKVATNTRYTRFGNDFLDMKPKAQVTRGKIGTLDYVKIADFWTSKDTINSLEKEPTECERYLSIMHLIRECMRNHESTRKYK